MGTKDIFVNRLSRTHLIKSQSDNFDRKNKLLVIGCICHSKDILLRRSLVGANVSKTHSFMHRRHAADRREGAIPGVVRKQHLSTAAGVDERERSEECHIQPITSAFSLKQNYRHKIKEGEITKMARVYNFSAGPSVLPEVVLKEAAEEMLDYKGTGMSVMEMSHRSKAFDNIIKEAEKDLRDLMNIPDNYKVLFLQGGASQQFAAIPMNLMKNGVADYIITGQWAKKAYEEAKKYGKAVAVASSADKTFSYIPDCSDLPIDDDADYVYICHNNTIYGTTYHTLPNTKGKILVADMSSDILSQPVNVEDYGMIYFGVQKNVGPAGVVVAIIREDLIRDDVMPFTPTMLKYKTQADADSLYNTPPCYGIYICGKVFKWVKEMGGLEAMKAHNEKKAKILYDFLDSSELFKGTVVKEDRSLMNVPFVTGDADLDAKFVKEATEAGFVNLKGHRTVGGMRASIYNAMPIEGVEKLVEFMKKFEAENK